MNKTKEISQLEKLLVRQTAMLSVLTQKIATLSVKIAKIEEKLDYRKQAEIERFKPPANSAMLGITPNIGED